LGFFMFIFRTKIGENAEACIFWVYSVHLFIPLM
jgi:hypothetical protein